MGDPVYAKRGALDTLHARETYGDGIPSVPSYDGPIPDRFEAWPNRKRADDSDGLHCFVDDTRLEPIWKNPGLSRRAYEGRVVISPDFSLYPEWPRPLLDWNVYRARWTACAMAARGALVIPSVSWCDGFGGDQEGLPVNGTLAISAYGAKRAGDAFRRGFDSMSYYLTPQRILVVGGAMPSWLEADPRVVYRASNTIGDRR